MAAKQFRWDELSWRDFQGLDPERTVAVLPVGATEQHGPHLPVCVDAAILAGAVARTCAELREDAPVLFLPPAPVGVSPEHVAFPGTLSISTDTALRLWTEIGESVARAGLRKLMILNSHGGQVGQVGIVARDLRVRCGMFVVTANTFALDGARDLFDEVELRHGIHGGAIETSIMLHLLPDLVRDGERKNFVSAGVALEAESRHLLPEGAGVGFGWQMQDLHPDGACGNAASADAARGERLVARMARSLVELLDEVSAYPLSRLAPGPGPSRHG